MIVQHVTQLVAETDHRQGIILSKLQLNTPDTLLHTMQKVTLTQTKTSKSRLAINIERLVMTEPIAVT